MSILFSIQVADGDAHEGRKMHVSERGASSDPRTEHNEVHASTEVHAEQQKHGDARNTSTSSLSVGVLAHPQS